MADTLILNADAQPMGYVPLSTLNWEESVKLMFLDRVEVVAEYAEWEVSSPSITLRVPSVMMMHDYVNMARGVKFSSKNVKLRDAYKCQYCGINCAHEHSLLTMDHVIPRARGGKSNWTNMVAACVPCNLKKAHYDKMKPARAPVKPTYYQLVDMARKYPIQIPHESWIDFLGWDKSLVTVNGRHK